ncbi:hypothetical protein [Pseudovibrio denitrificans]|nr:hypothetical protein [Pseudovibrio denitrificans]
MNLQLLEIKRCLTFTTVNCIDIIAGIHNMARFLIILASFLLLAGCVTTKTPEERGAYRINKVKVIVPNGEHSALVAKQLKRKFNQVARESAKWVPAGTPAQNMTIVLTKVRYSTVFGFKGSARGRIKGYVFLGQKAQGIVYRFEVSGDPGKGTMESLSIGFNKYYSPEWVFNRLIERLAYTYKKNVYLVNDSSYFDKIADAPTPVRRSPSAGVPSRTKSHKQGITPPPLVLIGG